MWQKPLRIERASATESTMRDALFLQNYPFACDFANSTTQLPGGIESRYLTRGLKFRRQVLVTCSPHWKERSSFWQIDQIYPDNHVSLLCLPRDRTLKFFAFAAGT